jgi:D-serine deaminase-like pyridoxal phosphate-dependent protein
VSWDRLKQALGAEPLPAALVDLDAFDANVERVLSGLKGKKLRVATKSIRCVELTKRVLSRAGDRAIGAMTYTAAETAFLAKEASTTCCSPTPPCRPTTSSCSREPTKTARPPR